MKTIVILIMVFWLSITSAIAGPENKWYTLDVNNTTFVFAFEEEIVRIMIEDIQVVKDYEYVFGYVLIKDIGKFVLANYDKDLIYIPSNAVIFKAELEY